MPELKHGKDCCGCSACMSICPKDAITMTPDGMGFKYPTVDPAKCIECNACERVCAFSDDYYTTDNYQTPIAYGGRVLDEKSLMKSRSGGVFAAVSDEILQKNGSIYGVAVTNCSHVAHIRVTTSQDRDKLRGSKYVQSDMGNTFRRVKEDLTNNKWVLFSGTPCQTAGLRSYIPLKLQEKLLVMDIVCHGVPSPAVWESYVNYMEAKTGKRLASVNFRDKERFGWAAHKETLTFEDGSTLSDDIYTYLFYRHIMLRPSCEICHYTNTRRPSDITIADYWGWEKNDLPVNNDDKGLSLILINSPKGKMFIEAVKHKLLIKEVDIDNSMQPNLSHPTAFNQNASEFKKDFMTYGFKYVLSHYGNKGSRYKCKLVKDRIVRRIKRMMK